jgi:hypothetical protein
VTTRAALDEEPAGIGEIALIRILVAGLPRELSASGEHHRLANPRRGDAGDVQGFREGCLDAGRLARRTRPAAPSPSRVLTNVTAAR